MVLILCAGNWTSNGDIFLCTNLQACADDKTLGAFFFLKINIEQMFMHQSTYIDDVCVWCQCLSVKEIHFHIAGKF